MNRTKIEWCDFTWNPIKGLCPEACWYCYARAMYRRFKKDETLRLDAFEITVPLHWADQGKRIFVCSTIELFHPDLDPDWRDQVFEVIEYRHDLTFIILTKRPERIDRAMPDNVWLGVSVTGEGNIDYLRVQKLQKAQAKVRFVSAEPLLGDICPFDLFEDFIPDWLIVGRLTGHGKKHYPGQVALDDLRMFCIGNNLPLFVKNNLKDIWPGPLIQEYPALPEKEKP